MRFFYFLPVCTDIAAQYVFAVPCILIDFMNRAHICGKSSMVDKLSIVNNSTVVGQYYSRRNLKDASFSYFKYLATCDFKVTIQSIYSSVILITVYFPSFRNAIQYHTIRKGTVITRLLTRSASNGICISVSFFAVFPGTRCFNNTSRYGYLFQYSVMSAASDAGSPVPTCNSFYHTTCNHNLIST